MKKELQELIEAAKDYTQHKIGVIKFVHAIENAEKALSSSDEDILRLFVNGAKRQKNSLEQTGWGHAIWCNFQRKGLKHCNCGINDIQYALKKSLI